MKPDMLRFDYDALTESFNQDLSERLRGHGATHESLALWVASENPVDGINNLIEAAIAEGESTFQIEILQDTLPSKQQQREIIEYTQTQADISFGVKDDSWIISVISTMSNQQEDRNLLDQQVVGQAVITSYKYGRSYKTKMPASVKRAATQLAEPFKHKFDQEQSDWLYVQHDHIKLGFKLDANHNIANCGYTHHEESQNLSHILEIFCAQSIGLPLREAIDHGLQKIIFSLTNSLTKKEKADLPAILLPFNLGPEFVGLQALLSEVREQHSSLFSNKYYNEYNPNISDGWRNNADRETSLRPLIANFCRHEQLNENALVLEKLEDDLLNRPVRVFVSIERALIGVDMSALITKLEKHLKLTLESQLQVYYLETNDTNRTRRLG